MSGLQRDALWFYESIAAASTGMLDAARASDWDALVEHEKNCARLIDTLRSAGPEYRLGPESLERKNAIIRRLLAEDAEIRRLTQPWLARLEDLLHSSVTQRRLGDTYR
jgi:flagellar protein FliT